MRQKVFVQSNVGSMEERSVYEPQRIGRLIAAHIKQQITAAEEDQLNTWINESEANAILFKQLIDSNTIDENLTLLDQIDSAAASRNIMQASEEFQKKSVPGKWVAWVAAASVIIIAGVTIYQKYDKPAVIISPVIPQSSVKVLPGSKKATLFTGDGKIIDLEKTNGIAIEVGQDAKAMNENNILSYKKTIAATANINTLKVPVGGEYQVLLSDGTKVWLNSATSLKYPASFIEGPRSVELEGEAYFEVANDKARPFTVKVKEGYVVEVLGTRFNVHSYAGENTARTTLVEGQVKINISNSSKILVSGQQAVISKSGTLEIVNGVNTEDAIAWTKGFFSFTNTDIHNVMAQVSRWYGVDVEIKGNISQKLTGKIYRSSTLSQVLKLIEISGNLKSEEKERKVIIHP